MNNAPFFNDIIADAPAGRALWLTTSDDVKIRIGLWNEAGTRGTVLLFPGRTEFIEKYAHTAADLAKAGFATVAVDWRGQGLADRLLPDPLVGHVGAFHDYQLDVQAVLGAVGALKLPQPLFLLAHSMGGAIGLRALYEKLPVASAVFTGPMFGIQMPNIQRPFAWGISALCRKIGLGHVMAPGTSADPYVSVAPFEDNTLTTDPEMFDLMRVQLERHPELSLSGPSLNWLFGALLETRKMSKMPAPSVPSLTFLGTNERIVEAHRIQNRMESWNNGRLIVVPDAEHEVLMERADLREPATSEIIRFFQQASPLSDVDAAPQTLPESA